MGKRVLGAFCLALLSALVCGTSARAAVLRPVPGLAYADIGAADAQRLNDGAGIIVAGTENKVTLARVMPNGAPDRAYGVKGLVQVPVPKDFRPSMLTVDPANGTAWIGGQTFDAAWVIAVNARGTVMTGFGTGGSLRVLPPHGVLAERPFDLQSLAWRAGRLLISTNTGSCQGCAVTELSAASGRVLGTRFFDAGQLAPDGCAKYQSALIRGSGAVWVGSNILFGTSGALGCPAQTLEVPAVLESHRAPVPQRAPTDVYAPEMASVDGQVCEAGDRDTGQGSTVLWGAGQDRSTTLLRHGTAGSIVVVPTGGGSCSALVAGPGAAPFPESVFQIAHGGAPPARTILPRDFSAEAMYRSTNKLVVVGTVGDTVRCLTVPLVRGPFVHPRS